MADERWERLERLFERALTLSPAARHSFLHAECYGDDALRERVESLLAAHDQLTTDVGDSPGFLEALDPLRARVLLDDGTADGEQRVEQEEVEEPGKIGRYQVVRRLGRGGMGVVYLARDPGLERSVALKLLPAGLGADAKANRRLMEEARLASALDHPNLGTVYEVGEAEDGRLYIAMAYYEGETLRQRLERGRLPVDEVLSLAAQIAEGLSAAHRAGIVHRDIKPENLIITGDGLVKIVDFGVAKATSREATRTGATMGTVAYMSPEQTRGRAVDRRTDVWSLGVVLYEMSTGVRPFGGGGAVAIHAIRNDQPDPLRELRPDIPPALAAITERCLEKDPELRFPSASGVCESLKQADRGAERVESHRVRLLRLLQPASLRQRISSRRVAIAGVLVLIVAVASAGLYGGLHAPGLLPGFLPGAASGAASGAESIVDETDVLLLADFSGATGDPRIGQMVTEALRIDLLQSPTLRLADADAVAAGLLRMRREPAERLEEPIARELAVREGYGAVITGEVGVLGGRYVLTARVISAADGATLTGIRETARDSTMLIDAVDRLSKRLRERIGESVGSLEAAPPLPRVATASLPALRRYAEGYALARSGGDDARIAALLEEAVALDSTFAAAQRSLAITYWNMRADRERTVAATRAAYELRDRLSDRERYLIEASYQWQVLGSARRAAEAYRRVLAVDPENFAARTNLGLALLFDGRPSEAERVLREGLQADVPPALPLNVARALYFQDRTEAALAVIDSVANRPGGSAAAEILRARLLGGDGRWAEAEAVLNDVLDRHGSSPQVRVEALRGMWHLALVRGRLEEAERRFAELEPLLVEVGVLDALARALVQRAEVRRTLRGDPEGALAELDSLLRLPSLDVLTVGATVAPRAAAALAAAGDTARAARLIDSWEALPPEGRGDPDAFSSQLARARIELVAGRPAAAAERLRRASSGTIQAINYLPDLGHAYQAAGQPDSAIAVFERYLAFRHTRRVHRVPGDLGPVLERLAALYEEVDDTARALAAHDRLIDLWVDADPELQPRVEHARGRITALWDDPDPGL